MSFDTLLALHHIIYNTILPIIAYLPKYPWINNKVSKDICPFNQSYFSNRIRTVSFPDFTRHFFVL